MCCFERIRTTLVVTLVLVTSVLSVSAADVPLNGNRIMLRDDSMPARRQTFVKLADRRIDLADIDPTVTGATAEVGRLGGDSPLVLELPAAGWRPGGTGPADFRYRSRTGPVRSARLSQGKLVRLWARGPAASALDGAPQGDVGFVLAVGDVRFCGVFGGRIRRDDGTRFLARNAPAPLTCPDVVTTPPSATPTPSAEPTTPASTATPLPSTATPTPEETTHQPTATATAVATPSPTVTATTVVTPSPEAVTPTPQETTPEPTASATPVATPTVTPTIAATPTPTPTASPCIGPECAGCTDADSDGAGIGLDCAAADCDDASPDVHPGALEICNARDDDCDALVDEGFDLMTDEQHCGSCGNTCDLPQATAGCVGGACTVASCDAGWSNADGTSANGCECARNEAVANDTATTATYLGNLPDTGATASTKTRIMPWSATEGLDVDWFRIDAADDFIGNFSLTVTLTDLPANNYRMTVYRGAPPGDAGTYACGFLCLSSCHYPANRQIQSNGASSLSLTLDEGSVCSDDGGTFYVSLEQSSGAPACTNLTLTIRND